MPIYSDRTPLLIKPLSFKLDDACYDSLVLRDNSILTAKTT